MVIGTATFLEPGLGREKLAFVDAGCIWLPCVTKELSPELVIDDLVGEPHEHGKECDGPVVLWVRAWGCGFGKEECLCYAERVRYAP